MCYLKFSKQLYISDGAFWKYSSGLPLILISIEAFCLIFLVRCFSTLWNNCCVFFCNWKEYWSFETFLRKIAGLADVNLNRYLLLYQIYFIVKLLTCIGHGSIVFVKFSASFGRCDCCRKYNLHWCLKYWTDSVRSDVDARNWNPKHFSINYNSYIFS